MNEIWANSKGIRLKEHIKDMLDTFGDLQKRIKDKDKEIQKPIRKAIICHDFGKVLPAFRIRTLKNKDYKPSYLYYNLPHSLFSLFWTNQEELGKDLKEDLSQFILSSITFHYWQEGFDDYISRENIH